MYICICKGITDHEIHDAAAAGATSFRTLQKELGVSTQCGCCEADVRAVLEEFHATADSGLFYAAAV